jgi:hypothetical protein
MPTAAYATIVQVPLEVVSAGLAPEDSFAAVALASMPLDAFADPSLAAQLRQGDVAGFFAELSGLFAEDPSGGSVSLETLDVAPEAIRQIDTVQRLVGSVLRSGTAQEAQDYWNSGTRPSEYEQRFVNQILQADLLAEHSKAQKETFDQTALKVAGGIGGGAMTAGVAVMAASGVTGVVVLIAGTGGIALVGIGATYVTYRLLTRRRR